MSNEESEEQHWYQVSTYVTSPGVTNRTEIAPNSMSGKEEMGGGWGA